jgi:hypothetical protein
MIIESKQAKETRHIQLVETNNIARALKRIKASPHGSDRDTWKMAIYHAMFLAGCWHSELQKVRQALELP